MGSLQAGGLDDAAAMEKDVSLIRGSELSVTSVCQQIV